MNFPLNHKTFHSFFLKVSLYAVLVMAFAFPFSFALFNIGIVVLMISFFSRRILSRDFNFFDSALDKSLILYFIVCGISVFSEDLYRLQALQGMQKMLRYLLLFAAAREAFQCKKEIPKIVWAFLAGGLLTSFDGFLQLFMGVDPLRGRTPFVGFEQLIRITASFNNPNGLVIYLALLVPFAGYLAFYGTRYRAAYGGAFILMLAATALTFSRTSMIALTGAVTAVFLLRKDFRVLVAAAVVLMAAFFFLPGDIRNWISQVGDFSSFLTDISRSYHHQAAWNMIVKHPWFGVGINTFDINYGHYRASMDTITRWSAHQAYLQIAAETGVVGFLSFGTVIFFIMRNCFKAFRGTSNSDLNGVLGGLGIGMLAFLITGFFESNFWQPRQTYFFWFWAGIACGIARLAERNPAREA